MHILPSCASLHHLRIELGLQHQHRHVEVRPVQFTVLRHLTASLVTLTLGRIPIQTLHHLTHNTHTCEALQCVRFKLAHDTPHTHDTIHALQTLTQLRALHTLLIDGLSVHSIADYIPATVHTLACWIGAPAMATHDITASASASCASLTSLNLTMLSDCTPASFHMFRAASIQQLHINGMLSQVKHVTRLQSMLEALAPATTQLQLLSLGEHRDHNTEPIALDRMGDMMQHLRITESLQMLTL